MRFYKIEISDPTSSSTTADTSGSASVGTITGTVGGVTSTATGGAGTGIAPASPANTATNAGSGSTSGTGVFTSVVNGQNDPGALDIEFDVHLISDQPNTSSFVRIKGIDPKLISQASNFNNKTLKMWAGYTNGLPLANDQVAHQGLILQGPIFPCFGNWVFNELTLDFFVMPGDPKGIGGPTNPKNIVHNMPTGQPLSTALKNTLQIAFPKSTIIMNISDKLKLNYPDWGVYQSLEQLGNYVKGLSHSILGVPPNYKGVSIVAHGDKIHVTDGTTPGQAININYQDLVGQPTWINVGELQTTTLLRGDIPVPGTGLITLPKTLVTQTQSSASNVGGTNTSNILNFSGTWQVKGLRHIGKFRSPGYDCWITQINAVQGGSSGGSDDPGGVNQDGTPATTAPTGPDAGPNSTWVTQQPLIGANAPTASFDPITGQPTTGGIGSFGTPGFTTGGQQTFTPAGK
jgi:hypothetical protein